MGQAGQVGHDISTALTCMFMCPRPCGCGAGESGCTECGCCKSCAGELVDGEDMDELKADIKADFRKVKDSPFELPPYLIMGEFGQILRAPDQRWYPISSFLISP